MAEIIYGGQSFTGVINALSASSGQVVRADNFDYTVDQNGDTFFFGFLTKFPQSEQIGNAFSGVASLGVHLFLPQSYSQDGDYRFVQSFTDGNVRYYDKPSLTWISIGTGFSPDYHRSYATYATRDVVYMANGIDPVKKWRTGWTALADLKDKGTPNPNFLTGNLYFTDDSDVVTGIGTIFLTEIKPGDYIRKNVDEEFFEVQDVRDDTYLYLYTKYVGVSEYGGIGVSQKAIDSSMNGRYVRIWKDRLIIIGGATYYYLMIEDGTYLLQEDGFKLFL